METFANPVPPPSCSIDSSMDDLPMPLRCDLSGRRERYRIRKWLTCVVYLIVTVVSINSLVAAAESVHLPSDRFFESDVRRILKAHCWHCHGEDGELKGMLDLRWARTSVAGGESGPAVTPGDVESSLLWQRVESGEMPPSGKGLTDVEKESVRLWIEQGARTLRPEPAEGSDAASWTEEERMHWSFQPLQVAPVPTVQRSQEASNSIDLYLLAELEKHGRGFSPQADRATLIRRLAFDLLGQPPEAEWVTEFIQDKRIDAYERLVDRMLASPEYGERWGRHWLDAAGYADSDGYTEADMIRPWAYRYRDYVIQSFNQDKPWTEFVTEQLAGDELLTQPFENLSAEDADKLIATGYLRMAPDGTGDAGVDANVATNDVVADTIKIVSTSMLGMTVGCAQCHNHRYDPISQADYYRLRAVFEPALDWKSWRNKPAKLISLWQTADKEKAAAIDIELAGLEVVRIKELDEIVQSIFDRVLEKVPAEQRPLAIETRATPADKRTEEQKALFKAFPSLNVDRGSATLYEPAKIEEFNKRYEKLQGDIKVKKPPESFVACLSEPPGHLPPTHLFSRGDFNQPRELMPPADLSIFDHGVSIPSDDPQLPTSGRRLAIAKLWTNGTHPLLPRAIVNRIWMHHFGRGLSNTPGDFGALGERPSHPELLDWLASQWIAGGWYLKPLHRMILTSSAYRQSSVRTPEYDAIDSENRLLGRMPLRRLEAEAIRDAMLEMTGKMSRNKFGEPIPINPDDVGAAVIGTAIRDGNGIMVAKDQESIDLYRRSIYLQVRRSLPFGMLESFDTPALTPNCDRRSPSTVAPQSLLLMNNSYTILYSERFAEQLIRVAGNEPQSQIRLAWRMAFAEEPSDATIESTSQWLANQKAFFDQQPADTSAVDPAVAAARGTALPSQVQALAMLCQAIFSSNRFLYVD